VKYLINVRTYANRPHTWAFSYTYDIGSAHAIVAIFRQSAAAGGFPAVGADIWLVPA